MNAAIHAFFTDLKFQAALVVIFVDFVLGIVAAVKTGTFRLSYVAAFARDDLLGKLVPWLVLYVASKVAGSQQLVIPGINTATAATALYAVIVAAWAGSILSSLHTLGFTLPAPITAGEHPDKAVPTAPPAPPAK